MRAQADDLADQTKVAQPVSHPLPMQQVISVWVRDPRMQKNDFWHAYLDYEICLHTNSLSFTRKISSVRRRYSEFVWLRQTLQRNSLLMVKLPELPPKNPFFSLNNARQIAERMKGLQKFLELTFRSPLLLSDSCLHLFLQSDLSIDQMEACAAGRTLYTVEQVVLRCGRALQRFHSLDDQQQNQPENHNTSCGSGSGCPVFLESSSVVAEGTETSVVLDFAPQSDREEETC